MMFSRTHARADASPIFAYASPKTGQLQSKQPDQRTPKRPASRPLKAEPPRKKGKGKGKGKSKDNWAAAVKAAHRGAESF